MRPARLPGAGGNGGNAVSPRRPNAEGAVLVTGSSTGIGKACALHLNARGFTVFAGIRNPTDGDRLKAEAPGIRPLMLDVTEADTVVAAAAEMQQAVGSAGLRGLVNNAGIVVVGPMECIKIEDLRRQFEVNVVGQIAVIQAFLPLLRQARGRIVNMGSIFGLLPCPYIGAYAASKFALEAVTDAMRVELAPWGIEVSIVEPGGTSTAIWDKSIADMELWRDRNGEAHPRYAASMAATLNMTSKLALTSGSPRRVALAVAHALTSRTPKTRYRVGRDTRWWVPLRRMLPDRLCDRIMNRMLRTAL